MGKRTTYHEQDFITATKNKFKAIGLSPKYLAYRAKWKLASKYPIKFKAPIHADIELSSNDCPDINISNSLYTCIFDKSDESGNFCIQFIIIKE